MDLLGRYHAWCQDNKRYRGILGRNQFSEELRKRYTIATDNTTRTLVVKGLRIAGGNSQRDIAMDGGL